MAKITNPQDDSKEIKVMLQKLFTAVKTLSSASEEQSRINRELMKVMSLLNSGFVDSADDANKLINTIKDNGFSLTDEFIKKWAKARKITDEDLSNIIKKFHQIDDIGDDIIDSANDYTDLLEDQIGSMDDQIDLSTKLLKSQNKIAEAISASKKQADALGSSTGNINDIADKLLQKNVDLTGMFDGMFKKIESGTLLIDNIKSDIQSLVQAAGDSEVEVNLQFNPLTGDLNKEVKKVLDSIETEKTARLQGLQDYYLKNTELQDRIAKQMAAQNFTTNIKFDVNTSDITTASGLLEKGTVEYQNVLDQLTKIVSDNSLIEKVNDSLKDMINLVGKGKNISDNQLDAIIKYKDLLDDSNKVIFQEFQNRFKDLSLLETQIEGEKHRLILIGRYTNQLSAARGVVEEIGKGFEFVNSLLPSGISDFLGISQVSLSLLDAHKKGIEKFSEYVKDGGDLTKSLNVYMEEMGPSIRTALNPMTLLVAAGAILFQTLRTSVETYKDMASEMKISILQAKQLHEVQLDILTSQKNQFTTMDDIKEIQREMIDYGESMKNLNTKAGKELILNLSEVGKAFGYGSEQAAKLQQTFTSIGADEELALNLQTSLGFMAEMSGLSPQIISQDLIDGAEEVSIYFAGMPEKAAEATLQIRRMGMSIQKAGEIAGRMLNLESFMTDMYELQAMTSGGIDFSKAFDKGIMGDIEGMTKDIMKEIGTTAEYNKMDFLTRKKIAGTLGMSTDELAKSVKLNEQIAAFSGPIKDDLEANISKMGDISKLNKEQIQDRLKQIQSTDRLNVAWDKIKGVLLKALIPLAETFADAIDAISPFIDVIIGGLKAVGMLVKVLIPLVKGMLAPFKFIGDIISKVTSYLDESASSATGLGKTITWVGSALDKVGKVAYGVGVALGAFGLLFKLPAVLSSIAGVFKTIFSFLPGVGTILESITGGLGGIFKGFGKKSQEAAKESEDPMISMTSKIQTSMIGMVDSVKTSMTEMVEHIKQSVSSAANSMKTAFSKSPTSKLMEEIKSEGIDTTKVLSSEVAKSSESMKRNILDGGSATKVLSSEVAKSSENMKNSILDGGSAAKVVSSEVVNSSDIMKKSVIEGSEVSKKKLKEIKEESKNLIPKKAIKESFSTLTSIGTKSLAVLATGAITSFIFAKKEGEHQMSGMSETIQSGLQMAAMGGSTLIVDALQEGIESVFSKKFDKHLQGGVEKVTKVMKNKITSVGEVGKTIFGGMSGKLSKGFEEAEGSGKGLFSKIGTYGKSIFKKVTSFGKSTLPEVGDAMADSFDQVKEKLDPVTSITEKVENTISEKTTKKNIIKEQATKITPPKEAGKSVSSIGSIFEKLSNTIKSAWSTIKSVVMDIIKFVGSALKSLTEAIGKSIENLLKGIGRGLSSFKTDAVKGAAALVLVSGALWITSKALENFANVGWESIAKGIVTLGALTGAAYLLGKISGDIILGAAAIGILGASLIPTAYAMEMFNKVNWGSIVKAGISIAGLAVMGTVLSGLAPEMIIGAAGLGIFSAALLVTGAALEKFNGISRKSLGKVGVALVGFAAAASVFAVAAPLVLVGAGVLSIASVALLTFSGAMMAINLSMKTLDVSPISQLTVSLIELSKVSAASLFEVSAGIMAISASIAAMSLASVGTSIVSIFGSSALEDLEKLSELANPLSTVNSVISQLSASLLELSNVIQSADFTDINKLNDIDVKSLDQNINQKINTVEGQAKKYPEPLVEYKVAPQQTQIANTLTPKKESVAQNVKINNLPGKKQNAEDENEYSTSTSNVQNSYYGDNNGGNDIYNRPGMETKKIEMLLMRLVQLMEIEQQKPFVVQMNGQKVGTIVKKENNK